MLPVDMKRHTSFTLRTLLLLAVLNTASLSYYENSYDEETTLEPNIDFLETEYMDYFDWEDILFGIREFAEAKRIQEVPQPEIVVHPPTCSSLSNNCTLTCEGNTTGAEPVTYSWKKGDGDWMEMEQVLEIIKAETQDVKNFTCRMTNFFSEKESEALPNPFLSEKPPTWPEVLILAVRVTLILTLYGVLFGFFAWQKRQTVRKLICPCQDRNGADNPS